MNATRFELLLFSTDAAFASAAVEAGIDGLIVDWEGRGKPERQAGADTEINCDTPADLRRIRRATPARIVCRINGVGETTAEEIETAVGEGADEILVPMVRTRAEMELVCERVAGRSGVGMLVETMQAVERVSSFRHLPLARVYVGLNDLAIERRSASLFEAVRDGTVAGVREQVIAPFGFGGLTLPDCGSPIPCRLLMGEMTRLDCQFSFLRRSFHRDARGLPLDEVVSRIRAGLAACAARTPAEVERDRASLDRAVAGWDLARAASG